MKIKHSTIYQFTNSSINGTLLFVFAVIARLGSIGQNWPIGRYVTPDELAWVQRSVNMRRALLSADWAATIQAGHPGVITTWLGAIGVQLTLWFSPSTAADLEFIQKLAWINPISGEAHQHLAPFLIGGRIMVILTTSAGIWLIYRLLSEQFTPTIAITAAAFLALDPWIAGLSGLLHVDALLATFITIALLLVLKDGNFTRRRLLLAGIFTSLAILNKLPGVVLLGLVPAILFTHNFMRGRDIFSGGFELVFDQGRKRLAPTARQIGLWLAGSIVTSAILLPALWADPTAVYDIVLADSTRITSKRAPIFFMGSADFDIGWQFYPLAVLIRQSPLVTLGLAAGSWMLWRYQTSRFGWLFTTTFLLFCLFFWVGITASSREFIRYTLPISFVLTLLSGLALGKGVASYAPTNYLSLHTFHLLLLIIQICWMAWFWRYPLSAANLFTGGPWASVNQVALGWGDGISQGAKFAAAQPNAGEKRLFTNNVPAAAPFYPGEVYLLDDQTVNLIRPNDFVLLPLNVKQVDPDRWRPQPDQPLAEQFPAELAPIHTVRFNRLERAWLYSNIPAGLLHNNPNVTSETTIRFGPDLTLKRANLTVPENKFRLVTQLEWEAAQGAAYQLIVSIEDAEGSVWLRKEEPLVGISGLPAQQWSAGKQESIFQKLTFPADMPPASYMIKIEVFDEAGARMGVFGEDGQFRGTSAVLGQITSPLPNKQPTVTVENRLEPPFVGHTLSATKIGQGETLRFDLWWWHPDADHSGDVLLLKIGEEIIPYPVGMVDWRADDIYRIKPNWQIPVDYPAGEYLLAIGRASDEAQQFQPLGRITVEERDRLFALPDGIDPLFLQFSTVAILQHIDAIQDDQITLNLVWQANRPDGSDLTMFIHLRDQNGDIIKQLDRPPAKPTSLWLNNEVILDSATLSLPDSPVSEIAIGLYDPTNGQRLAIRTLEGNILPNGEYLFNNQ